jgi:penicillin-binding protein 2
VDIKLQEAVEHALGDRSGSVAAIDPATGEVLTMVSKPSPRRFRLPRSA